VQCATEPHEKWVYDHLLTTLLHVASNTVFPYYLKDLFEEALTKSDASAWVCPDDNSARAALAYLQMRGKKIPNDISVFGFDNSRESLEHELSTYDFGVRGMLRKAIMMILNDKTRKTAPMATEVEGYVVERRTTRR
jgi:DNA-binding LacI/PurR family transcriptional regulator